MSSGSALPHQIATQNSNDSNTGVNQLKTEADGSFKRQISSFRNWIKEGGEFPPEKDRYHLYISYGCPWATRTLIVRQLKGLEDIISVSAVSPLMGTNGWPFANVSPFPGADVDTLNNADYIKEIYYKADPNYKDRPTVPVLWDKKKNTIVNNESSEIIRMFNSEFNQLLSKDKAELDLYPEVHRAEIDELNDWVYHTVNNGVYKAGFAKLQEAYEAAVYPLFESLDRLEKILTGKDYLVGDALTEADVRLFVTIVRFDPAYFHNFKCNLRSIRDGYPAIHLWLRKLYWNNPAFKDTCRFDHIKQGYYRSISFVNPHGIVPIGPVPDILPL